MPGGRLAPQQPGLQSRSRFNLACPAVPCRALACAAEVGEGDRVAIWGAGPVGLLAAHCAFVRGASRVFVIDKE